MILDEKYYNKLKMSEFVSSNFQRIFCTNDKCDTCNEKKKASTIQKPVEKSRV